MQGGLPRGAVILRGGEAVAPMAIATGGLMLTQCAPRRPVLDDPIEQGFFEADVMSYLFAFDPFMAKNFRTLGQKFLIER